MKKILTTLLLAFCGLQLVAATPGTSTRSVRVADFTSLQASAGVNIYYTQGPLAPVAIEAPSDILPYIVVERSGNGTLKIFIDTEKRKAAIKNNSIQTQTMRINVSAPNVSSFSVSSGASIKMTNDITLSSAYNLAASSGGSISLRTISAPAGTIAASSGGNVFATTLNAKDALQCSVSSGASVKAKRGAASALTLAASSGANLNFAEASADKVDVTASSGASASVDGIDTDFISATATSAANISLSGSADKALINVGTASGATISSARLKCPYKVVCNNKPH